MYWKHRVTLWIYSYLLLWNKVGPSFWLARSYMRSTFDCGVPWIRHAVNPACTPFYLNFKYNGQVKLEVIHIMYYDTLCRQYEGSWNSLWSFIRHVCVIRATCRYSENFRSRHECGFCSWEALYFVFVLVFVITTAEYELHRWRRRRP